MIAGRNARPDASTGTTVPEVEVTARHATRSAPTLPATSRKHARAADHHASGSCSDRPSGSAGPAFFRRLEAAAITSPLALTASARAPCVPTSSPMTTRPVSVPLTAVSPIASLRLHREARSAPTSRRRRHKPRSPATREDTRSGHQPAGAVSRSPRDAPAPSCSMRARTRARSSGVSTLTGSYSTSTMRMR